MTEADKATDLNPHYGQVIGFVGPDGELRDSPAEAQFALLINVGEEDDVKVGERVLVFALGQQIVDPQTGKDLGHFEIVRGQGRVKSVQTRMAVITSSEEKSQRRAKPLGPLALAAGGIQEYETVTVAVPFRKPTLGDLVRFI